MDTKLNLCLNLLRVYADYAKKCKNIKININLNIKIFKIINNFK